MEGSQLIESFDGKIGYADFLQKFPELSVDQLFDLGMKYYKIHRLYDTLLVFLDLKKRVNNDWREYRTVSEIIDEIYNQPIGC